MKTTYYFIIMFCILGCVPMKTHSPENTTQKANFEVNSKTVYQQAIQVAMEMSWEITVSDSESMIFSGKTPGLGSRWGDVVNVYVNGDKNQSTLIVKSRLGHSPNVKYIQSYLEKVKRKMMN